MATETQPQNQYQLNHGDHRNPELRHPAKLRKLDPYQEFMQQSHDQIIHQQLRQHEAMIEQQKQREAMLEQQRQHEARLEEQRQHGRRQSHIVQEISMSRKLPVDTTWSLYSARGYGNVIPAVSSLSAIGGVPSSSCRGIATSYSQDMENTNSLGAVYPYQFDGNYSHFNRPQSNTRQPMPLAALAPFHPYQSSFPGFQPFIANQQFRPSIPSGLVTLPQAQPQPGPGRYGLFSAEKKNRRYSYRHQQ